MYCKLTPNINREAHLYMRRLLQKTSRNEDVSRVNTISINITHTQQMFTPACHKIKFWCRSSKDPIKTNTQHREVKRLKWQLHSSNNFYNCFEEITRSNNNLRHSWKFLFRRGPASLHRYLIKRYSKEKLKDFFFLISNWLPSNTHNEET